LASAWFNEESKKDVLCFHAIVENLQSRLPLVRFLLDGADSTQLAGCFKNYQHFMSVLEEIFE